MAFIYSLVIRLYVSALYTASFFNPKARLWTEGRRGWREKLIKATAGFYKTIWVHCASLGEFEQGRPLMEKIREERPEFRIVLTFFSPSGYEIRKGWPGADYICYLPADTASNAKFFIETVKPEMALFIKYEFWNNYISVLYGRKIPLFLVSGIFRGDQHFFRWYGNFFRSMLNKFTHIFVQDERSAELLRSAGIERTTVTGDTRFDRVMKIARSAPLIPEMEKFGNGEKIFLAGSSWPKDEEIIARYINSRPGVMKWIFAPHETDKANIERIEKLFTLPVIRFSDFYGSDSEARVMIIDTIGMLSSAYRYAHIAAVGGGFGKGIHNILEPACWGIPVLFGPNHKKFREAVSLLALKGAFCFNNYDEFREITDSLLADESLHRSASGNALSYVSANAGATEKIINVLFEKDINKR